jgi:deazaflavin-dependent oxidoreductase (nitroreductase family)
MDAPSAMMVLAEQDFAYVTNTGRLSGLPREIEIWFALEGDTIYLLSGMGDRAHWVRNLRADPRAQVRIGNRTFAGRARFIDDPREDARARVLLGTKYGEDEDSEWRLTAVAVAIDLPPE